MGHVDVDYRRGVEGIADTADGLSGFWGDAPILSSLENRRKAYGYIEDGMGVPVITADGQTGGYEVEVTATGTPVFGSDARVGGGLILTTGTADNDEIIAVYGGNNAAQYRISDAAGEAAKLWYEVSILPASIAATVNGFFSGLCETFAAAAAGLIEDDGTIDTARDLIGFFKPEGDAGTIDFIYQKGAAAIQTPLDGFATLSTTAATKLGFVYDPDAPDENKVRVYLNGVEQSTYVTAANIAAATFPDAVLMAPHFNIKNATGAAQTLRHPFWGCFQDRL